MGLEQRRITSEVLASNYPVDGVLVPGSEPQEEIRWCVRVSAALFAVLILTYSVSISQPEIDTYIKMCSAKAILKENNDW